MMDITRLKLTIFNAFLGNIGENVRALAYDVTDSKITIYGYMDREPCDDDYESIDIAVTEIMSSYSNFTNQDIILIKSCTPLGELPFYKGWIFVRKE